MDLAGGPGSPALMWAVVALVVVAGAVGAWLEHQRRQRIVAACAARGWSYVAEAPHLVDRWPGPPFGRGFGRRARNHVAGEHAGHRFSAFDYTYRTRHTDANGRPRTTTHTFSVVVVPVAATGFPDLEVAPEGMLGRAWGRLTGADVELESEAFNRAFTVTCADRRFAYGLLHPQLMTDLLDHPDVAWGWRSGDLLAVSADRLDVDTLPRVVGCLAHVAGSVPQHVHDDYPSPSSRNGT